MRNHYEHIWKLCSLIPNKNFRNFQKINFSYFQTFKKYFCYNKKLPVILTEIKFFNQ